MFVINMKMQLHVCTRLYLCQTNGCLQVVVSFLVCSILVLQKKKKDHTSKHSGQDTLLHACLLAIAV